MIYIENLDFGYQKKREVFSGLNLSLTGGHIYGLLGKNGAGKTTLLKLIGGLLFPLRGRIEVCDAIPRLRKPSFLSDIFFIPEEICLPDMKMKDYFPLICRFYPKFDEELLFHAMEIFEVSESDKMGQMSYGQRKKALISLGIACNTRLLMMDEPTNGYPFKKSVQAIDCVGGFRGTLCCDFYSSGPGSGKFDRCFGHYREEPDLGQYNGRTDYGSFCVQAAERGRNGFICRRIFKRPLGNGTQLTAGR